MIGISTSAGPKHYWQFWLKDTGFNIIELDLRHSYFPFYQFVIDLVKKEMEPYDLSLHSASDALFSENIIIRKAHQHVLLSEIEVARIIGATEIVFHAPIFLGLDILKTQESSCEFLINASKKAIERGITLLLEYPAKGDFSKGKILEEFFKMFPNIFLCLDLGHLHRANKELEKEKKLINKFKEKIVYLHINDCSGDKCKHRNFNKNNILHYKELLYYLKKTCPVKKYIIETNNEKEALDIFKSIECFPSKLITKKS